MAEIATKYLVEVGGLLEDAHKIIDEALAFRCNQPWCKGYRMCHRSCKLRQWFLQTGDPMFHERAQACAGRCMGWDLASSHFMGYNFSLKRGIQSVESWNGWEFIRSAEVDFDKLGEHCPACVFAGFRNTDVQTKAKCEAEVLQESQALKLQVALQKLKLTAREIDGIPGKEARFDIMALRLQSVLSVLEKLKRSTLRCKSKVFLDPTDARLKTSSMLGLCMKRLQGHVIHDCGRTDHRGVRDLLELAWKDIDEAFHALSTAAVLGSLFVKKVVLLNASLPAPLPLPAAEHVAAPSESDEVPAESMVYEEVIQSLEHLDPPAVIPPEEAQLVVDVQGADWVVNLATAEPRDPEFDQLLLGRLNRMSRELRQRLSDAPALRQCRRDLEEENFPTETPEGAMVFVKPEQFREAMFAVCRFDLKPSHLIFSYSLGYLLDEALDDFHGKGCWIRGEPQILSSTDVQELEINLSSSSEAASSDADQTELYQYIVGTFGSFITCMPMVEFEATVVSTGDLQGPNHNPRHASQRVPAGQ